MEYAKFVLYCNNLLTNSPPNPQPGPAHDSVITAHRNLLYRLQSGSGERGGKILFNRLGLQCSGHLCLLYNVYHTQGLLWSKASITQSQNILMWINTLSSLSATIISSVFSRINCISTLFLLYYQILPSSATETQPRYTAGLHMCTAVLLQSKLS